MGAPSLRLPAIPTGDPAAAGTRYETPNPPQGYDGALWDATMRDTSRQAVRRQVGGVERGGPHITPRPWATGETQRQATFMSSYSLPMPTLLGRILNGLTKLPLLPDQPFSPWQNQRILRPLARADRPTATPWDANVSVT